jgi:hypothetical protein
MGNHRRVIAWAIGGRILAMWPTALDAVAAPQPATGGGCRGLSPASAQDCTSEELRAALDDQP